MTLTTLYLADRDGAPFESARTAVDIVSAGDSITGWNNYGRVRSWGYRTYPRFLQEFCAPLGLRVANCGIAGEISANGVAQVREYLDLFPHAKYFIIGFGTNDLDTAAELAEASRTVLDSLDQMAQPVLDRGNQLILFNVPYANRFRMPSQIAEQSNAKRDYHNPRLAEFCQQRGIPLVDVCSRLIRDEHFVDELHPSDQGARVIAEAVFTVLSSMAGPR